MHGSWPFSNPATYVVYLTVMLIWNFGKFYNRHQTNQLHATCMDFFPYSTQFHQFLTHVTVTAKPHVHIFHTALYAIFTVSVVWSPGS